MTESRIETGIGTEKILMVGKVQERPEDTENAPGVETGTGNGQGPGRRSGTETDTADMASVSVSHCIIRLLDLTLYIPVSN